MLERITDMPAGTIGFKAVGEVEDDDWEKAVEPVLRDEIASGQKVRLLYLIGPEALQNVAKYANASGAKVRLSGSDGHLSFAVEDDGVGFDPGANGYGTGMQGMADRLAALGGELHVTSAVGAGTVVEGTLPVEALGANLQRGRPMESVSADLPS
jgi:glucose-6-phosphate-specific signal transduction histidine kinase